MREIEYETINHHLHKLLRDQQLAAKPLVEPKEIHKKVEKREL